MGMCRVLGGGRAAMRTAGTAAGAAGAADAAGAAGLQAAGAQQPQQPPAPGLRPLRPAGAPLGFGFQLAEPGSGFRGTTGMVVPARVPAAV